MKIVHKKPFWWFITGKKWGSVAMTWGNTIYSKDVLREDLLIHEKVHIKQCKGKWYISLWFLIRSTFDNKFYQALELEAYNEQYQWLESSAQWSADQKRNILINLSKNLSDCVMM